MSPSLPWIYALSSVVAVTLADADGIDTAFEFPCNDEPIRLDDALAEGPYGLSVAAEASSGLSFASVPQSFTIASGETTETTVDLLCETNGIMDGCGGA